MGSNAEVWIPARDFAKILGISIDSVRKVAKAGDVRIRQIPGMSPRYNREDVIRIEREAVKGGKQGESAPSEGGTPLQGGGLRATVGARRTGEAVESEISTAPVDSRVGKGSKPCPNKTSTLKGRAEARVH
jgi:hypothetical protein